MKNYSIKCDVNSCVHNCDGCNCSLSAVKITCGTGEQCTCCHDFVRKV